MKTVLIQTKKIGYGLDPFIIAEAGVNHNGLLKNALKLVDAAKEAGVDAVKFQTFKGEQVAIPAADMAAYQKKNLGTAESQLNMLRKLELNERFYGPIMEHCRKNKLIFLSTPHGGFESVDFLKKLNVPAYKFGSGDLTNLPLLRYTAKIGKPLIIGTGMATMAEVKEAIRAIKEAGNSKIIMLHCTTNYPCPFGEVNLNAMVSMIKELDALVGYSDHTAGQTTAIMAAALGACTIEKHFTLDKSWPGPDHKASMEPDELKEMVKNVRLVKTILGSKEKRPVKSEYPMIKTIRKSVVSLKDIERGEKFSRENLGIKRPSTGLHPKFYDVLMGARAKKSIKKDLLIKKSDYA
jgi:N,N'-diacetyllegionaminate synthase